MVNHIEWELTIALIVAVRNEFVHVRNKLVRMSLHKGSIPSIDRTVETFYIQQGNVLFKILFAQTPEPSQGSDAAAWITTRLADSYRPHLLVMIGLCAGDKRILKYGDVVVATSTVRHDFGKLHNGEKDAHQCPYFARGLRFQPRSHRLEIGASIKKCLSTYLPSKYHVLNMSKKKPRANAFKVALGIMSTGNQVTQLPNVFEYLHSNFGKTAAGDEDKRALLALEMEAHSVAYAAEKSKTPWLIIKGVCDYADNRKSDNHHERAIRNATDVAIDAMRKVGIELMLGPEELDRFTALEKKAVASFATGDIEGARDAARDAHLLGCRSKTIRRRYVHALTQFSENKRAEDTIADYRHTRLLDDELTLELDATMLLRKGLYDDVQQVLTDDEIRGHRQLLYLRAVADVLATDGRDARALKGARDLLVSALRINKKPPAWWIMVNLYWVLRLLKAGDATIVKAFEQANTSLRDAISKSNKGTPRVYLLLLLSMASTRRHFDSEWKTLMHDARHIQVSLEILDLIRERMQIFQRVLSSDEWDYNHYWTKMCEWLRAARAFGQPMREATRRALS